MKAAREQPNEAPALDPLTALIRAAVRAELDVALDVLRAELQSQQPTRSAPDTLLTLREAAQALRCSERKIRRMVSAGLLRAARLSSGGSAKLLFSRADLERVVVEARV